MFHGSLSRKRGHSKRLLGKSKYVHPSSDSWDVAADFGSLGTEGKQIRCIANKMYFAFYNNCGFNLF